jgi:hypothetical protein
MVPNSDDVPHRTASVRTISREHITSVVSLNPSARFVRHCEAGPAGRLSIRSVTRSVQQLKETRQDTSLCAVPGCDRPGTSALVSGVPAATRRRVWRTGCRPGGRLRG